MFEFAYLYSVRNGRKYGAIPDFGHNNILLAEKLQVYSAEATDGQYCEFKNWTHKKQWKGNNSTHSAVPGTCPIGIQPISSDAAYIETNLAENIQLSSSNAFYAEQQQLKVPLLPIKGDAEWKLFCKILQSHGGTRADPDFSCMLQLWIQYVDGKKYMPKAESHLRAMYKSYESVLRKKDIVSKFGSAFADVKRFLQRSNDLFDATFYNFDQIHDGVEVLVNAVELSKFKS